jgi:hypothetical protein
MSTPPRVLTTRADGRCWICDCSAEIFASPTSSTNTLRLRTVWTQLRGACAPRVHANVTQCAHARTHARTHSRRAQGKTCTRARTRAHKNTGGVAHPSGFSSSVSASQSLAGHAWRHALVRMAARSPCPCPLLTARSCRRLPSRPWRWCTAPSAPRVHRTRS